MVDLLDSVLHLLGNCFEFRQIGIRSDNTFRYKIGDLIIREPQDLPIYVFVVLTKARRRRHAVRRFREDETRPVISMHTYFFMLQPLEVIAVLELGVFEKISRTLNHPGRHSRRLH